MSEVTREEFDALVKRVDRVEATLPKPEVGEATDYTYEGPLFVRVHPTTEDEHGNKVRLVEARPGVAKVFPYYDRTTDPEIPVCPGIVRVETPNRPGGFTHKLMLWRGRKFEVQLSERGWYTLTDGEMRSWPEDMRFDL